MSKMKLTWVISFIACLSLVVCLLPAGRVRASGGMYVVNPGFELPGYGGIMQAWEQTIGSGGISWASDRKYSGSYSVKITDISSTEAKGIESEKIFVTPYQSYTASAKVYLAGGSASIYIRYYSGSDALITSSSTGITSPLNAWTEASVTLAAPSNASYMRILLYTGIASVSTAYFDDVTLTRNDSIANKGFESQLAGWTQTIGNGSVGISSEQAYGGNSSLKIADTNSASAYGMECEKISITAGETYRASAMCYISSGYAGIYIRFYDSSNNVVGNPNKFVASPVGEWTKITVTGTAPADAVKASVLLYSTNPGTGTAYYDEVDFASAFTFIGNQIYSSATKECAVGTDNNNSPFLYTVTDDVASANFVVVDLNTNQVVRSIELPGAQAAWRLTVASDNTVYVGAYPEHKVYKYTPGDSFITEVNSSVLGGERQTRGMTSSKTTTAVYGGTYPSAIVYKVQGSALTKVADISSENYAHSLAVDDAANMLYCGTGSHAQLIRYNLSDGTSTNILPSRFSPEEFVYDLTYAGGKLFFKLTPSNKLIVMDKNTLAVDAELDIHSRGTSELSPIDDKIYYSANDVYLYSYDISSKTATTLANMGSNWCCGYGFVQLSDQVNWPGYTLCGLSSNSCSLYKYNLQTGAYEQAAFQVTPAATIMHNVKSGPDGKIYSSGYLSGGIGVFDPAVGTMEKRTGISQSEGIANLESRMYFGTYPGANLKMVDTSAPWNPMNLASAGAQLQDRPVALLAVPQEGSQGMIFMGTIAAYGYVEGALSIYDVATGSFAVKKGIVGGEGISSLAYKDGKVYGGSTIYGGIGSTPTQPYARIFIYDVASDTSTVITPFSSAGHTAITCLMVGPDGNIWGWDQGRFFIMNPANNSIIYSQLVFPGLSADWKDASMEIGDDRYVYGDIDGKLFKIDPATRAVTVIRDKGDAFRITKDESGSFYFTTEGQTWLWKFEAY